jgi:hypothetical protein
MSGFNLSPSSGFSPGFSTTAPALSGTAAAAQGFPPIPGTPDTSYPGTTGTSAGGGASAGATGLGKLGNIAGMVGPAVSGLLGTFLGPKLTASINAPINAPLISARTGATGMETMLTAPTTSGVLPAGTEQALDYERRQGIAAIHSQAGKTGMTGTTMERDAMENLNARIEAQKVRIEQDMLKQAGTYANLADADARTLSAQLNQQNQFQQQQMANALSKLTQGLTPSPSSTYNPKPTLQGGTTSGSTSSTGAPAGPTGATTPPVGSTGATPPVPGSTGATPPVPVEPPASPEVIPGATPDISSYYGGPGDYSGQGIGGGYYTGTDTGAVY